MLAKGRGAYEGKLLKLHHLVDQAARTVAITDPPARHGVGFAESVEHKHIVVDLSGTREWCVIAKRTVNLIADEQYVLVTSELTQCMERPPIMHRTSRVGGVIDDDGFGPGCHRRLNFANVNAKIGIGVHHHRPAADNANKLRVHHKIGIEEDDFIARIEGDEHGQHEAAGSAAGEKAIALGMSVTVPHLGENLAAQFGDALGHRVGVFPTADGLDGGGLDRFGHVKVRHADAEVDRILEAAGQVEDLADAGDLDGMHTLGNPVIVHDSWVSW